MNPSYVNSIQIRNARLEDISDIAALVRTCGPYLSSHLLYLYFIYVRFFGETCWVAIADGRIVGWLSVLPVGGAMYFLHQLGISPEARGKGVALRLFSNLIAELRARHGQDFSLNFTAAKQNKTVHQLNQKVAESFHLWLQKLPEPVPVLDEECEEELYEMCPFRTIDARDIHIAA